MAAPLGPAIGTAAAGGALYMGGQLGYRIAKSPTLRKYYKDLVKSAATENAAGVNRSLKKMDRELSKSPEKKGTARFVLEE